MIRRLRLDVIVGMSNLFSIDFFVIYFFVYFFVCFFVSKITRKQVYRFA